NELAVDFRLYLGFKVLPIGGLDVSRQLQGDSGVFGNRNRQVNAFDRSNPSDENQVGLFVLSKLIGGEINAMVDGSDPWQQFLLALKLADANVVNLRVPSVEFAEPCIMGAVQSTHNWNR